MKYVIQEITSVFTLRWIFVLVGMLMFYFGEEGSCQQFKLFGLVADREVIRFDGMLPNMKKGRTIYAVENDIALIGTKLRSLNPHPTGGLELLTWEDGDDRVLLKHITGSGSNISTVVIAHKQSTEYSPDIRYIVDARSSIDKRLIAVVTDIHQPSTTSRRTVRIVSQSDTVVFLNSLLSQFEIKYQLSSYFYDNVGWNPASSTLFYTDCWERIVEFDPVNDQHSVICEGEFLGFVPGNRELLLRRLENRLFICDYACQNCKEIIIPQNFRRKNVGKILITPDTHSQVFSTPRFIPLVEDARSFWRSSLDGSQVENLGGIRGFNGGLCFGKDLN